KIRERLRCLCRSVSPWKEHELAKRMDVNEYIDTVPIAKQVNIVGFRLRKPQPADKTCRTGIARGVRADDTPHKVAIAVRIGTIGENVRIVASVLSPPPVATGFHYMVATIGIGARQHPDVQRLHHDPDIKSRPFSATVGQAGRRRICSDEIKRELDNRVRIHQFPSMHPANDQNPSAIFTAASAQTYS